MLCYLYLPLLTFRDLTSVYMGLFMKTVWFGRVFPLKLFPFFREVEMSDEEYEGDFGGDDLEDDIEDVAEDTEAQEENVDVSFENSSI